MAFELPVACEFLVSYVELTNPVNGGAVAVEISFISCLETEICLDDNLPLMAFSMLQSLGLNNDNWSSRLAWNSCSVSNGEMSEWCLSE